MTRSLGFAAAFIAAGAFATGASAAPASLAKCGTVIAGGAAWQVAAAGLSCSNARSLVKKLAAMPTPTVPNIYYPGTHLGMRCLGGKKNGARGIECVTTDGRRSIVAGTKS
jgi:hypothetical protein